MLFQNYALYPHMMVAQNIAFGLQMRKVDAKVMSVARYAHAISQGLIALFGTSIGSQTQTAIFWTAAAGCIGMRIREK